MTSSVNNVEINTKKWSDELIRKLHGIEIDMKNYLNTNARWKRTMSVFGPVLINPEHETSDRWLSTPPWQYYPTKECARLPLF